MKRSRFSEEQIAGILAEFRAGTNQSELSRKYGVSTATISKWNSRFGDMQSSDVRKLKALEDENSKLKRIVADQAVEIMAAKDVIRRFS
ncbi:MAG: transposase [Deltaproteobacteria bacterium]|nr:transposase [Deltaproteobacteria bacterium]